MKDRNAVALHYLESIIEHGRGLTEWEESFIDDLSTRLADDHTDPDTGCPIPAQPLTDGQFQTLEKIYDERV